MNNSYILDITYNYLNLPIKKLIEGFPAKRAYIYI